MKTHTLYTASLIFFALVISIVFFAATSKASYSATIAVVDVQKIMNESKAANSIREQVKKKKSSFQAELDKKEKELQKQDQELAKQRSILSKEAFEQQYKEFRQTAVKAQSEIRAKKLKLDQTFSKAITDVQKKVSEIVANIAKEKNVQIAIARAQVIYAGGAIDITDEVLEKLDDSLSSVSMKF